jgi:glyoxylase-like metal-dependent hydrolase (beta-lactamase superfamily II)
MPMDYFIWALRAGERTIVVDTGFTPEGGAKRGRRMIRPVADCLAALGVSPPRVENVIITHLHYDHAGNLDLFPAARVHMQDREMSFATGRHMTSRCIRYPFDVEDVVRMVRAVYADRVTFHDGDAEVGDGVSVHRVGGHTHGLQIVRVETARGPVVLASDAAHFYANMALDNPFPIYFDIGELTQGWRRAKALAGDETRIVPGHDPRVLTLYPAHAGDGEIVALHAPPRA